VTPWLTRMSFLFFFTCLLISGARGQGGPPLHTHDPDTPGSENWEINFGFTVDRQPQSHEYETPIVDFNFGAGNRVQLKFELPYLLVNTNGGPMPEWISPGILREAGDWMRNVRFFQFENLFLG
jgi:hypothetical protein